MSSTDFLPFPLPSLSLISSKICEEFLRGKRGKLGQGEIPIRVVMGPLLLPTTIITENIPLFALNLKKSNGTFSVTIPRCEKGCGDKNVCMPPTCIHALSHEILLRKCRKNLHIRYVVWTYVYTACVVSLLQSQGERVWVHRKKAPFVNFALYYILGGSGEKKRNTGTA